MKKEAPKQLKHRKEGKNEAKNGKREKEGGGRRNKRKNVHGKADIH